MNKVRSWFTHVHVDEAAQGRSTIEIVIAKMHIPETKEKSYPCFRSPEYLKMILEKTPSIPLWSSGRP